MAIIDNPTTIVGGGSVTEETALQYMLNNKTDYTGIAAGLSIQSLPTFTVPTVTSTGINLRGAFSGCSNIVDTSIMQFGYISSCDNMFYNCSALTTIPDFSLCKASGAFSAGSSMSRMFYGCTSLVSTNFDMSGATGSLFFRVGDTSEMFSECTNLTTFSTGNLFKTTASCINMYRTFRNCTSLQTVELSLGTGTGSLISPIFRLYTTEQMFSGCTALTTVVASGSGIHGIDVGASMFSGCTSLVSVTGDNFTNITHASGMFYNCSSLTTAPSFGDNLKYVNNLFRNCSSLVSAPTFGDTSNVIAWGYTFYGCTNLENVGVFNMSGATETNSFNRTFQDCPNLTTTSLNNILASIATATSFPGTKKLTTTLGLSSAQATTCTGLSNWPAAQAAGWSK